MKKIFIIILFIASSNLGLCQENAPLLTGKVVVSIEEGTIECDLTLSDYPELANNYFIRLNAGMNILNIQSLAADGDFLLRYRKSLKDTLAFYDEPNSYYFPTNDRKSTFLPKKLRFKYVGKFPVIHDTLSDNYQKYDWRGNIAFAYNTFRADGLQSAWFPTLYNIKTDKAYNQLRYDLEVECKDCNYLFINGSDPLASHRGRFKSVIPREPLLFLGDYTVEEISNFSLINVDFNQEEIERFVALNRPLLDFFSDYTSISFKDKITWIQAPITSKRNAWAFESYPTFVKCSNGKSSLKKSFTENYQDYSLQIVAHEYAHYYFGTLSKYNGNDDMLLNEGFAEFLSLKYLESRGLDDLVQEFITDKLEWVMAEEFEIKPLSEIKNATNFTNDRETYAYEYHALILWAIENKIGEEKMKSWIRLLLTHKKPLSDFNWYTQTLKEAIGQDALYDQIVTGLLSGTNSKREIKTIYAKNSANK